MRVTNHMLMTTVLNNLSANLASLQKVQDQMSSGKTVTRPSDDPVHTSQILSLRSSLAAQDRYNGNIGDAATFLNTSETAMGHLTDSLQAIRDLMLQGGTDTCSDSDRAAIAEQIDAIIDQMVEIGNTMSGSQYVFGGHKTLTPPLVRSGDVITYNGDNGKINFEVAQGVQMTVNADGAALFQVVAPPSGLGNTDMFNTLIEIKNDLKNNTNIQDLTGALLDKLDDISDHILAQRAIVGAKTNRMDMAKSRNEADATEMTKVLSNLEDVDITQISMEYSEKSYVYQAALATAAQVLTPSLVDYLAQ